MKNRKYWLALIILFGILNCVFIVMESWFDKKGVDTDVLIIGNLTLFIATALSFYVYIKSMKTSSSGSALRGMYGSFMIKFFMCLVAVVTYLMIYKKNVNKPALIICMGLYIIYTAIEVTALQKMLRRKKNG
jgi:hypothetical protein